MYNLLKKASLFYLKLNDSYNKDLIILKEIVNVLYNDIIIIFPTDTVYVIACNAFSNKTLNIN